MNLEQGWRTNLGGVGDGGGLPSLTGEASTPGPSIDQRFVEFYRMEYPGAVRLAALLTGSDAAAEDLVQEVFAAMLRRFDGLDVPAAYLRVAVTRRAGRWRRDGQRRQRRLHLLLTDDAAPAGSDRVEWMGLLMALPFRQRAVLVGRYWAGLSEQEIAEMLGCRQGTVQSLASRALRRLRAEIERRDHDR